MKIQYYMILSMFLILSSCSDEGINPIYGCTDPTNTNYDSDDNIDDGSCFCDPVGYMTGYDDCDVLPYTYNQHIYDILDDNSCLDCHTGISNGGLDLSTYTGIINGGNNGPIIDLENIFESLIITTFDTGGLMCDGDYGNYNCNLPDQSIIESWISDGAIEDN